MTRNKHHLKSVKPSASRGNTRKPGNQRHWPALPATLGTDLVAGLTLAAVSIPECMGYTKIAGTPVVTGLYTILLPLAAFALLGSSRHLVVGADSATAAILFSGLLSMGAQPGSEHWLALAEAAALLTAAFLALAGVMRLGFVANFLSRTVLVGFLSGVGLSLLIGQFPEMLGLRVTGKGLVESTLNTLGSLGQTQGPTLGMALGTLAVIVACERFAKRMPGSLLAVALAIGATSMFHLNQHGITTVGRVPPGWPSFGLPHVTLAQARGLLTTAASMFVVIVTQSAATARSYAQKYREGLNEDRDLLALGAANALAGVSGTFVVNGSPTKTAVVDAAGGRSQASQLTTAAVTLAMLLFATTLLALLPNAALAAIVFLIGVKLVDVRALRQIYRFRRSTFAVALGTLLAVVCLGVKRGIFVAIGLSILDHLRQEYHPKDVVLAPVGTGARWKANRADTGAETEPGLLVYRFEAPLFFANADHFAARLQALVEGTPHPVRWLVLDLVSMNDIDYTGGLTLAGTIANMRERRVTVALAQTEDVRDELERLGVLAVVGPGRVFESVSDAVDAFRREHPSDDDRLAAEPEDGSRL